MKSDIPKMPDPSNWVVNIPKLEPFRPQSELAVTALSKKIISFEKALDSEQELGFRLVTAGAGLTFHAERISTVGGHFVEFIGINEEGERMSLSQHVSQVSILLCALKKRHDKPVRIGFLANS